MTCSEARERSDTARCALVGKCCFTIEAGTLCNGGRFSLEQPEHTESHFTHLLETVPSLPLTLCCLLQQQKQNQCVDRNLLSVYYLSAVLCVKLITGIDFVDWCLSPFNVMYVLDNLPNY